MSTADIALLSLGCTVLGVLITRFWAFASESTTIRADVAKGKQDTNALGDKVKQLELKLFYTAMMTTPEDKRQEVLNALVRRLT